MANFVAKLDSLQQQLVFLPYVLSNKRVCEGNTANTQQASFDFSPKMTWHACMIH